MNYFIGWVCHRAIKQKNYQYSWNFAYTIKCYSCATVNGNTNVIIFIYESKALMRFEGSFDKSNIVMLYILVFFLS